LEAILGRRKLLAGDLWLDSPATSANSVGQSAQLTMQASSERPGLWVDIEG